MVFDPDIKNICYNVLYEIEQECYCCVARVVLTFYSTCVGSMSSLWDEFANWRGLGGWEHPALEYYGNGGPVVQAGESGEDSSRRARRRVPVE